MAERALQGHAFHGLCSKTAFAYFHGTAVARDFVEAPSQMLENWCVRSPSSLAPDADERHRCWTPEQLKAMSSHYVSGKSLPDDMIRSIIASKSVNQGLFNLRQLFHGKFDSTAFPSSRLERC